jgi:hypothetical protein
LQIFSFSFGCAPENDIRLSGSGYPLIFKSKHRACPASRFEYPLLSLTGYLLILGFIVPTGYRVGLGLMMARFLPDKWVTTPDKPLIGNVD